MGEMLWPPLCLNFKWIFFILADKKDNYQSFDEFEFRQDLITYYGDSSPWASLKLMNNVVTALVPSLLIGSSSFFSGNKGNH